MPPKETASERSAKAQYNLWLLEPNERRLWIDEREGMGGASGRQKSRPGEAAGLFQSLSSRSRTTRD
jgi:hypothetical protein